MKNSRKLFLAMSAAAIIFTGCGDDDDNDGTPDLPPIGGFNNSDEVSAANLLSKISFEDNLEDSKMNVTGTGTNPMYTVGKKGQAWQGSSTQPRYAIFDGMNAVDQATSFSIAFWMNSAQTVPNEDTNMQGKGTQGIFALVNPTAFWGGLNIFLENPDANNPTKLRVKMQIENKRTGVIWGGQSPIFNVESINSWVHIVLTYDAATSRFSAYKNGELGGINTLGGLPYGLFGTTASNILYADNPGGPGPVAGPNGDYPTDPEALPGSNGNPNNAPLYGAIDFGPDPLTRIVIGAHQFSTTPSLTTGTAGEPWATTYAGLLDEFRIYKAALTVGEVNALYLLESANR